ncbi:MAG TPA: type II toxin-antitoxin system VapC family toxin [Thiobacillus sp.]
MPDAGLVLDTHVWLWLESDPERLDETARSRIEQAARLGGLWVSVMSVWEIGMLVAKDRIRLSMPVDEWVRQASLTPGMQMLGIIPEIALESTRLPDAPHGDPVDRLLMASARVHNLTLVTADEKILDYSAQGHLKALKA